MTEPYFDFEPANGAPMRAVLVLGPKPWSVDPEPEPQVDFYDRRYNFSEHGQFIAGYYLSSIYPCMERGTGLNLHGGVPEWSVDADPLAGVLYWARVECEAAGVWPRVVARL